MDCPKNLTCHHMVVHKGTEYQNTSAGIQTKNRSCVGEGVLPQVLARNEIR